MLLSIQPKIRPKGDCRGPQRLKADGPRESAERDDKPEQEAADGKKRERPHRSHNARSQLKPRDSQ